MALTTPQDPAPQVPSHRRQLTLLHTLVTIALGYQLLFSPDGLLSLEIQAVVVLGLIGTVLGLGLLPARMWESGWIAGILAVGDTAATTAIIYLSGNASSDLYLTFFLILLIAAFAPTLQQMIAFTLLLCIAYGLVLSLEVQQADFLTASHLLGIPVLLVLAIFYGVLAETVRQLRLEKTVLLDHLQERKKLEEQLRMAQKMEAVGRLAGGIAHDFNNVLTVVMGYSERLLRRLDPDDPSRSDIQEIQMVGQRATSLTQQLLAFSRRQVLAPEVVNLNDLVANMSEMLRPMIGEDIQMATVLRQDLGYVEVDPGKIEQVIMNLVINSRDAMPHGGKLIIETANMDLDEAYPKGRVTIQPGPYVMFAVSDTGHGMDPEVQEHIFEPFYTTKEAGKGTGLGLSTVYGIVKQSNGFVFAYSEPGQGATFKIYLPRVAKSLKRLDEEVLEAVQDLPFGYETVLLVEDETKVRDLVGDTLRQHGYTVIEASQGLEAVAIGNNFEGPIHLLVTDVVMPKMSGRDVADRLADKRPDLKVLYMSGYTEDAIVHHGVLDPGIHLIQKPFTSDALMRKVREVLDASRPQPGPATVASPQ